MTWWTSIPGLTPIAAWDALSYDATGLIDQVGTNKLLIADPQDVAFRLKGVLGNGLVNNLQTTITLPAACTLLVFLKAANRVVFFSRSNTDLSAVWKEATGAYFSRNDGNEIKDLLGPASIDSPSCVAFVRGAAAASYFVQGAALSTTIPLANCPDFLGRITGWRNDTAPEYTLRSTDNFYAAGVWQGAATLADVQAIEAKLRVFLQANPVTARALPATIGRAGIPPVEALTPFGPKGAAKNGVTSSTSAYFAGTGVVKGTVKEKQQPANTPLRRKVQLIDAHTAILVREVWSDALTGSYVFSAVKMGVKYTVISYDHTGSYRAVIADSQLPEAM